MTPLYASFNYIVPEDFGRLKRDFTQKILASHEVAGYWSFQTFSVETLLKGQKEGPNMNQMEKAISYIGRESLISRSQFSMADKQVKYERHASFITLPHLPYVSNCREIPAHAPLFRLFEDAEKCKLPTFPNTKPVKASDLAMFSSEKLKSDSCDYTVKCVYDEIEVDSAPPFIAAVAETKLEYWFHLTPEKEKIPFYFTFDALNPNLLADGSSHSSENFYGHWSGKKNLFQSAYDAMILSMDCRGNMCRRM